MDRARILVIGMSHVAALARALAPAERGHILVVDLLEAPDLFHRKARRLDLGARAWPEPDVVVLSMGGNLHNWFTLLENPAPFALGDARQGAVPVEASDRLFVPRDMLRALFEERLADDARHEGVVHDRFPEARFVHLCAPPPVRALRPPRPGADLSPERRRQLKLLAGAGVPTDLRLAVWGVQRDVYMASAAGRGAAFLDPPAAALTPEGLLGDAWWDDDPTHANAAYGRLVLDAVLALGRPPARVAS